MRIEDLKRWHWCIVGLLVGAAFAFIRLSMLPKEEPGLERVAPHVFEADLLQFQRLDPVTKKVVWDVENICIHPPAEMILPGEKNNVYSEYLSYDVLLVRRDNHKLADRMPRQMIMALAGPKEKSYAGDLKGLTLREYLDKLNAAIGKMDKTKFPKATPFTYKFAWIETPKAAYSVFTAGGLVVIGLIWPTLLHFLVVAGFGRPPRTAEEEAARRGPSKVPAAVAKKGVTQDQMDELDRLEAELEAKLREGASEAPATAPSSAPVVAAAVPVLSAGPMEASKPEPEAARPRKGYGADQGDYYPTEVHGKKS